MMDLRAEKLAKARKKLKDHQEKKVTSSHKEDIEGQQPKETLNENLNNMITVTKIDQDQNSITNGNQAQFFNNQEMDLKTSEIKPDVITEMLISNKTNLELQINDLSAKLAHSESLYGQEINNHNNCKQQNFALQSEINNLMAKYSMVVQEASSKDKELQQLKITNQHLHEEKNNLFEQVELTKSMLTSKESENSQLLNQVSTYQNQIDLLQLQIQQLTNDSVVKFDQSNRNTEETEALLQNISNLELKIQTLQKDKEQINSHYEHYVRDLNERLKSELNKNETLSKDLQNLYNREHSLIEQISEMEIRLQNYATKNDSDLSKQVQIDTDLQNQYIAAKNELEEMNVKYNELKNKHMDCQKKINELTQAREIESQDSNVYKHDNVDISKLHADIASDKLAAQRATEQNKKLKNDIEALEQVIVKMGKDKLELTEKWTHEKQLNKGLALKLAELEECAKNMQNQLKAKDNEMIRLLNEYREMERKHETIVKDVHDKQNPDVDDNEQETVETEKSRNDEAAHEETLLLTTASQGINTKLTDAKVKLDSICIKKEDAMVKLQERFLNIMDEVANLSDEKHRLEHIILQLQNETDTICEYVALYQQQRSLLKKREEERSNQLKIYQEECDKLKRHLEELRDLLLRFAADEELASFLKEESRYNDLARVKELLEKLQNCSLINSKFNNLDLNIFYPCNCCSGQLITI